VACLLALLPIAHGVDAYAQDAAQRSPRGSYGISYQYIRESDVATNAGDIDIGTSDTHAILFDLEFAINEKWELYAGLPYVTKRYNGDSPHDPGSLDAHTTDEPFIDDGRFHSDFQDLVFGFRYLLPVSSVDIRPFIGAGVPTSDYPIFAHAAVGQNLQRLDLGAKIEYQPPFSNFFFSFVLTRAFVEQVADVNVDYWRFDGEIGYFINPRLAVRGYFLTRQGNGLQFPDDFPPPRNDLHWYEHEGVLAREYAIVGMGVDWSLSERNMISTSLLKSVHAKFIHQIDYGLTVRLTRGF